jgi:MoaA/NifB/PqqE/SkfB family radical SAM enzyme
LIFKRAVWDVTSRCNLRCAHCAVSDVYHRPQVTVWEVSYEEGLVILERLRQAGYQHLTFLGGEPLLRRDIVDLVAAARRMDFPQLVLVTNGTCLTPQLADGLLDAGLDELVVSLDGATAQTNDQVRGQGSYARALEGLATLRCRRPTGSHLKIVVQLTLSRPNLHEATMMVDLAGQMGLNCFSLNELRLTGNARRNAERLLPTLVEAMDVREAVLQVAVRYPDLGLRIFGRPMVVEYLNERFDSDLPLPRPGCSLVDGHRTLYVDATGSVSACSAIHVDDAPGVSDQNASDADRSHRLQTHSLSSILASPRFDRVKRFAGRAVEEGWQDEFVPCLRCHHRPDCVICCLFLREQKDKLLRECLLALQRQARWRKSQKQAQVTDQEIALARGVRRV